MIALVRGPGGLLRRLAADFVPLLLAVVVGGVALMGVGPWGAALAGGLAWPLCSALLRAVRRRPALARLYRLALLGHVLFWSVLGVRAGGPEAAGPIEVVARHAWSRGATVEAGYGAQAFALPDGTTLAGWGARPRRIRYPAFGGFGILGRHAQAWMAAPDDAGRPRLPMFAAPTGPTPPPAGALGARALVLRPASPAVGGAVALVRLDLVTSDADLHAAIRDAVADLGLAPGGLVVAATHTHSGPGGYSANPLSAVFGTDHLDPTVRAAIVDAAVAALRAAHAGAAPARVGLVEARDRDPGTGRPVLARNRRGADEDAIDDRVLGLRVDAADGTPLAVVLNYALHPYLYRRRHLAFDRDLVGGVEEALAARLPGTPPVLFVNGAQGDVGTQPGAGRPAERIADLAAAFAAVVAPAVEAAAPAAEVRVACARVERRLGTPRAIHVLHGTRAGVVDAVDRSLFDLAPAQTAADVLALPANVVLWSLGLPEARVGFTWDGDLGAVVGLEPVMGNPPAAMGAWVFELGSPGRRVALLWEPGEAVLALGRAWRAEAASRGVERTLVVGLANGSRAYLLPEAAYRERSYEAGATLFGPRTGADVGEGLAAALDAALSALDS